MCSAFIYAVPIGVVLAVTNKTLGLNVVTEMIIGYAQPPNRNDDVQDMGLYDHVPGT
jgi:hypothetical protein